MIVEEEEEEKAGLSEENVIMPGNDLERRGRHWSLITALIAYVLRLLDNSTESGAHFLLIFWSGLYYVHVLLRDRKKWKAHTLPGPFMTYLQRNQQWLREVQYIPEFYMVSWIVLIACCECSQEFHFHYGQVCIPTLWPRSRVRTFYTKLILTEQRKDGPRE